MKLVKKNIFDLALHEATKVDSNLIVRRVHKGFVYQYIEENSDRKMETRSTVFVPCERPAPSETVRAGCKYYNDGSKEWEYRWNPNDAGARCEYYRQFFRVSGKKLVPNCTNCPHYET